MVKLLVKLLAYKYIDVNIHFYRDISRVGRSRGFWVFGLLGFWV